MSEEEILRYAASLPGVDVQTASEVSGAPEAAWGDSFLYSTATAHLPADRRWPFATVVVHDYVGFDEASDLGRPGVFRLNLSVGRRRFADLLGYPPEQHDAQADLDYSLLDTLLPHPFYAIQAWVCILSPGERTSSLATDLLVEALERDTVRHRPRP